MSDVAEVKEALERLSLTRAPNVYRPDIEPVIDAARRWVRVIEGLDYEAAMEVYTNQRPGVGPVTDRKRVKAIVDAAVGVEKEPYRKLDPAWDGSQPYGGV